MATCKGVIWGGTMAVWARYQDTRMGRILPEDLDTDQTIAEADPWWHIPLR